MAYAEWGQPDGPSVVYIHGTPHSRIWCPNVEATEAAGVRLISVDRPGFGGSDPNPDVTYGGWPDDVAQLADALGIVRFAVVGWSGGGPDAAACAAKIPERLTAAGAAAGAGGPVDEQPGARERMDEDDRAIDALARRDRGAAAERAIAIPWIQKLRDNPEILMEGYEVPEGDRWYYEDAERTAAFLEAAREAVRNGPWGWAWDQAAAYVPWGFSLEDIHMEFHLWQGAQDRLVTQADTDFWASRIPGCTVTVWADAGHMVVSSHWAEILSTLITSG